VPQRIDQLPDHPDNQSHCSEDRNARGKVRLWTDTI